MTFRVILQLPIRELFELELKLGISSRAMDMARCVDEDVVECKCPVTVVIEKDPFTGRLGGYSSPFEPGIGFIREEGIIKDSGDPLNPDLIRGLLDELTNYPTKE